MPDDIHNEVHHDHQLEHQHHPQSEEQTKEQTEHQPQANGQDEAQNAAQTETESTSIVYQSLFDTAQAYAVEKEKKFNPQAKNETDALYFVRLIETIAEVPQEQFDSLPEGAQEWFNEAAEAFNNDNEVKPPEGFVSALDSTVVVKRRGRPPSALKKEPNPETASDAVKVPRVRDGNSMGRNIRKLMIEDQSLSLTDVIANLEARGIAITSRTTAASYRTDTLDTLRVAASMGRFQLTEGGKPVHEVTSE